MKAKQMWANEYTTWFAGCSPVPGWAKFARPSVPDLYSGPNFIWRVAHCPFLISPAFLALFALGDLSSTSVFFLSIVLMMYYLPPRDEIFGRTFNTIWMFWERNFFTFLQQETKIFMKLHENEHFPSNPTHPPFDWPNLARGASFFSSRILLTKIWFWYNKLFIFANITNNLVNFLESRSFSCLLRQGFKGYLTFCLTLLVKDFMKIQSNNILKCNIAAKFGLNFAKVCYTAPAKFDFQSLHSTKSEYSD